MVRKLSARVEVYGRVMLRLGQDGTDELEMVSFRLGGKYPWGKCPEGCKCPTFLRYHIMQSARPGSRVTCLYIQVSLTIRTFTREVFYFLSAQPNFAYRPALHTVDIYLQTRYLRYVNNSRTRRNICHIYDRRVLLLYLGKLNSFDVITSLAAV